ncbi:DUF2997 domain-containing protein [Nitrosomonas sp.]|uniref:DUF2997 domain-containing protein n=1 Tax=Nitrosomonas sp. TaxID=42353 RepID=UPI002634CF9D|nr:DUF2997 domain-containing protein [Nitrosomonas sp.]MCW5601385.1 DUF2997 domain-containing protein [Nitrosomonas sp.]
MTKQKQIKIRIFPDGQVQAVVMGIPGKKCTDYISVLENLMDAQVIDSKHTSEYYMESNRFTQNVTEDTDINQHTIQTSKVGFD